MRKFLSLSILVFAAACGADTVTNQPPTVSRQSVVTAEDTPVTFDLAVEDAEGDETGVTMGAARHGELSGAGLRWTYVPAADFHGEDVVTFTVHDAAGSATGQIAITVETVNDLPTARPDAFAARADRPLQLSTDALLANDADVDGDGALAIAGVSPGPHGDVAMADGIVVFTPPAGWSGVTGFTYALSDGLALSEGAVTITVGAADQPPVAGADQLETIEDGYVSVAVATLLANDTDPDRDSLFVTAVDQAVGGTVALANDTVVFTPTHDFNGRGRFRYTISDGAETAFGEVEVGIAPVDDPPVAVADHGATDEDAVFTVAAADLLANDVDVDGDTLAVIGVEAGTGGTVALEGGLITFSPAADFYGAARFTYKLSDGVSTTTAAFTLAIAPINDAPTAIADSVATMEDEPLVLVGPALVVNDVDVDGDLLTVIAVEALIGGTVTPGGGQGGNRITFKPDADFYGTAAFRYTISDGAAVASAVVVIDVAPVNDAPIAQADTAGGVEDEALVIPVADLVGNDTDVDGDALAVVAIDDVFGGTAALVGGHVTFEPTLNFHGAAGFSYQISDGSLTAAATISLSIGAVIDCGDGELDGPAIGAIGAGETCDDGNTAANDGCSASCQIERCGDGVVQTAGGSGGGGSGGGIGAGDNSTSAGGAANGSSGAGTGETCDDGNTEAGDGCGVDCQVEDLFATTAPVLISGGLDCSSQRAGNGRSIAVDAHGDVYAVMQCEGDAYLAMSDTRGATFRAPIALGIVGITAIAVAVPADQPGVAYVAATAAGQLHFTQTEDSGRTWSAPKALSDTLADDLTIEAFHDDVYVGVVAADGVTTDGVTVLHNGNRGLGTWTANDIAIEASSFDLVHDDLSGTLRLCSATPGFHVRVSTDQGATFAAETNPAGAAEDADWAIGPVSIFVAGTAAGSDVMTVIGLSAPAPVTQVIGLAVTSRTDERSLAAGATGSAYVATALDGGAIQLDRLAVGTAGFEAPRTIAASGSYPSAVALPGSSGVALLYTDATSVYATIQTY